MATKIIKNICLTVIIILILTCCGSSKAASDNQQKCPYLEGKDE